MGGWMEVGWTYRRTDRWMNEQRGGWMDGWINGWMGGWAGRGMDDQVDEWVDEG